MSPFELRGVIPPVVTPLTPDGELDELGLQAVLERLIVAGVDAVFLLGSTGEVAYFNDEQRARIVAAGLDAVAGRVPVLVGCIEMSQARVIAQAKLLASHRVAGVVATAPFYAINSPDEIADHYRAIRASIDVPLIAYDVPVRVHTKLLATTLVGLGQEGVLVGIKDSSGDDVGFRRLVLANRAAGSPLKLYTGHEVVCDGALLAGADGIVPGLANVDPDGYVQLWRAAEAGDWSMSATVQDRLAALMGIAFQAPGRSGDAAGVGGFKVAMAHLGVIGSATMAYPVQALSGQPVAAIQGIVDAWQAAK